MTRHLAAEESKNFKHKCAVYDKKLPVTGAQGLWKTFETLRLWLLSSHSVTLSASEITTMSAFLDTFIKPCIKRFNARFIAFAVEIIQFINNDQLAKHVNCYTKIERYSNHVLSFMDEYVKGKKRCITSNICTLRVYFQYLVTCIKKHWNRYQKSNDDHVKMNIVPFVRPNSYGIVQYTNTVDESEQCLPQTSNAKRLTKKKPRKEGVNMKSSL